MKIGASSPLNEKNEVYCLIRFGGCKVIME